MSTKTMRLPPRRVLTASTSTIPNSNMTSNNISHHDFSNITHKRKERDERIVLDGVKTKLSPSTMLAVGIPRSSKSNAPSRLNFKPGTTYVNKVSKPGPPIPIPNNQILVAGYLAHEFLSKGTLFGQVWHPTLPEGSGLSDVNAFVSSDNKSSSPFIGQEGKKKPIPAPINQGQDEHPNEKWNKKKKKGEDGMDRYKEVSNLLKEGEAHLLGIINPSQLGRFLQL